MIENHDAYTPDTMTQRLPKPTDAELVVS